MDFLNILIHVLGLLVVLISGVGGEHCIFPTRQRQYIRGTTRLETARNKVGICII